MSTGQTIYTIPLPTPGSSGWSPPPATVPAQSDLEAGLLDLLQAVYNNLCRISLRCLTTWKMCGRWVRRNVLIARALKWALGIITITLTVLYGSSAWKIGLKQISLALNPPPQAHQDMLRTWACLYYPYHPVGTTPYLLASFSDCGNHADRERLMFEGRGAE